MGDKTRNRWIRLQNYYAACAEGANVVNRIAPASANLGEQLALLVLAEVCRYEWSGDYGGPTIEMRDIAERILGETIVQRLAELP